MTNSSCFHCGRDIPAGTLITVNDAEKVCHFCCHGCEAVALSILSSDLRNYYDHRSESAVTPKEISPRTIGETLLFDRQDIASEFITYSQDTEKQRLASAGLFIEGITCAACIWLIEKHIASLPGIKSIHINHSNQRAQVTWRPDVIKFSNLLLEISKIGYAAKPFIYDELETFQSKEKKQAILRIGLAGIGMMQNMMLAVPLYVGAISGMTEEFVIFFRWVSFLVATPVVMYSARPFLLAAIRDIKTRHMTMDIPVSIAILIAYLSSAFITVWGGGDVYFDSVCMFTFFLLIGRYLEMNTRFTASSGLKRLNSLLPSSALLLADDGSQKVVSTKDLSTGNRVIVKPGENIPCDGLVLEGSSSVDESALTGEFLPTHKTADSAVVAGTTNIESPIVVSVGRVGQATRIAAVLKLMQEAMTKKPSVAHIADKVAGYFVSVILITSLCIGAFWYIYDASRAFEIVLSILVVTCPCALSLATPTALTAAMDKMRSEGILILKAHTIETLAKVNHVYLDKTGTLTEGKFDIVNLINTSNLSDEEILSIASALEDSSNHPIASAFKNSYSPVGQQNNTASSNEPVKLPTYNQAIPTNIKHYPGAGIEGYLKGEQLRIGNAKFIEDLGIIVPAHLSVDTTILFLASAQNGSLASFEVSDKVRGTAQSMVKALHEENIQITVVSGDNRNPVRKIAAELGISEFIAEASPEDKLEHILQNKSPSITSAMLGDGINDLPIMAAVDVSISMANAADINKLNADAVLLRNDLQLVPRAVTLAKKTQQLIAQNLMWALMYNLTALPLAAMGAIPPFLAAAGMSLSSIVVVLNSLRVKMV